VSSNAAQIAPSRSTSWISAERFAQRRARLNRILLRSGLDSARYGAHARADAAGSRKLDRAL
jgi:hypothetical protein